MVDMRWGVRDENISYHQTSDVYIQEIHNCQRLSVGPSFLVCVYISSTSIRIDRGGTGISPLPLPPPPPKPTLPKNETKQRIHCIVTMKGNRNYACFGLLFTPIQSFVSIPKFAVTVTTSNCFPHAFSKSPKCNELESVGHFQHST